jgi:hypothetical protein
MVRMINGRTPKQVLNLKFKGKCTRGRSISRWEQQTRKMSQKKNEYRRIFMRRTHGKAKINEQAIQQDESYKVEM